MIVIDLDDEEDGADETPSKPPGLYSPVSSYTSSDNGSVTDLDDIPSKPPRPGSCLFTSIVIKTWSKAASWPQLDSERTLSVFFDCHRS